MFKWENTDYQKIVNVAMHENNFIVGFENGDTITEPREKYISSNFKDIDWDRLTFNEYEVIIPAKPSSVEIPWDKFRVTSDKEFAKYLAIEAEEKAKRVGVKIKTLREKQGIRSNDLAERAGITPQTLSRIEQGHTDVGFGTLRKILAAMGCTLRDLANQEMEFEMKSMDKDFPFLLKRLSKAGIDSNLFIKKILPPNIQQSIATHKKHQPEMLLNEAANYVCNIYSWKLKDIWGNNDLRLTDEPASSAFFKRPSNANVNQVRAYSHYAFYLAKIILKARIKPTEKHYPKNTEEFKRNLLIKYRSFSLESLMRYTWDLGVLILPLNDPGVFHGASWNIEGTHVIILKQNTTSHARWIFDLLHELYHVFVHLQTQGTSVIETEMLSPFSNNDSQEELEANAFANQVIFGNSAEKLAEQCVAKANWKLENLKSAVSYVSKHENVREDFLSNYMAFRLNHQGENWWNTAVKMQITEPDPLRLSVDILKQNISMASLSPMDFNLLNNAITN